MRWFTDRVKLRLHNYWSFRNYEFREGAVTDGMPLYKGELADPILDNVFFDEILSTLTIDEIYFLIELYIHDSTDNSTHNQIKIQYDEEGLTRLVDRTEMSKEHILMVANRAIEKLVQRLNEAESA